MKSATLAAAALIRLAASQTAVFTAKSPDSTTMAGSPTVVGSCGQGYTYCGYILRDHQGYQPTDIVQAYCAANVTNCANGQTKTDPFQALYLCLPAAATPKERRSHHQGGAIGGLDMDNNDNMDWKAMSDGTLMFVHKDGLSSRVESSGNVDNNINMMDTNNKRETENNDSNNDENMDMNNNNPSPRDFGYLHSSPRFRRYGNQRDANLAAAATDPTATGAPASGGGCATATTGNRLELAVGCKTCLNPPSDHVGRCDRSYLDQ